MSKTRSYNNKVVDQPCSSCKEQKWRVTVNATDRSRFKALQPIVQTILITEAKFSPERANSSARAIELLPTPNTLIYAGDKDIAFAVLDGLLAQGVDAGIASSKDSLFK